MKLSDIFKNNNLVAKKIPCGYTGGLTWAIVKLGVYDDEVLESGFSTKKAALEWAERNIQ